MRFLIIFTGFLLFFQSMLGQDAFEAILQNGKGTVEIRYKDAGQFVNDASGKITGAEYEIIESFFQWVESKEGVEIQRIYNKYEDFGEMYMSIADNPHESGVFSICSYSVTAERLKEVKFSPSYMPDIEVMVSSKDLPVVKDSTELTEKFKYSKAVTVKGSTFEADILDLAELIPNLNIKYVASHADVIKEISTHKNTFGFLELPTYLELFENGVNINRQNLFAVQRDGYGFIYPINSDWHGMVWEYFQNEENKVIIRDILLKHFSYEVIEFLEEVNSSSSNEIQILLLEREKDIEELRFDNQQLLIDNERLDKEMKLAEADAVKTYLFIGIGMLVIVLFLSGLAYYIKNRDHKVIVRQKEEVEQQKNIIEEKHRLITDSIHYAKTIQNAMLQGEEHTNEELPDHFVFFVPKDVVSGDFYWSKVIGSHCYFAAVDCTGHGVPGGFMSVLGISLLNDILFDHNLLTPAEILEKLTDRVIKELDQTGEEGASRDGMDISLARINLETLELVWAGAHNPLYIFRKGKLIELKANKQPIGYYPYRKPFDDQTLQLEKGDMIYSSTDGYPDQFGGERGKKLKSSGFKQVLSEAQLLSTVEQKKYLLHHFKAWKGACEQVDDACVVGMRI